MDFQSFHLPAWQWDTLVHAMLHSLWQAPLMAGMLWVALRSLAARHARSRYVLCLLAHAGVLVVTIATASAVSRAGSGRHLAAREVQRPGAAGTGAVVTEVVHVYGPVAIHRPWTTWAGWAWACGAGIALVRTAVQTVRAAAMAERGAPVVDATILKLVARLAGRLGIRRAIRVVSSADWRVPGIVGFIWPTLLLPAAMIGGIPAEQLEIILAHELSHIRRRDYLVNVWQQIVEAFLFFNPAVWWIGRQIRREREACCDARAVAITGNPAAAARTLADFAQRLFPVGPALVMRVDGGSSGDLMDRIRRILRPNDRLAVVMPWYSTATALITGLILLLLLGNGVDAVVAEAQILLTPTERVEQIATMQKAVAAAQFHIVTNCNLSGMVHTADQSPLPSDLRITKLDSSGGGCCETVVSLAGEEGRFTFQLTGGVTEIAADADGYAPAFAGTFEAKDGAKFPPVDIVIDRGFAAVVHVVDPEGKPLAAARVESTFVLSTYGKFTNLAKRIGLTDGNGNCILQHVTSAALARIAVTCDGFQFDRELRTLDPKTPTTIKLLAASPATGIIVDAATGQPIAGASILMAANDGSGSSDAESFGLHNAWRPAPPLAVSDSAGRFCLSSLRNESNYAVWVIAAGHGSELVTHVHAGQQGLTIKLGPARIIRGRITGDLSRLSKSDKTHGYQLHIITEELTPSPTDSTSFFQSEADVPVTVNNGVGTYEIDDPAPEEVDLEPPGLPDVHVRTEDVVAHGPYDFDLPTAAEQQKHRRVVVFKFDLPAGAPLPRGSLDVMYLLSGQKNSYTTVVVPIKDGEVRYEVNAPTCVGYNGESLAGYCVGQRFGIAVDAADDPMIVTIPVKPAGAARGRVLEPDGQPCASFSVSEIYISGADPNGYPSPLQPFNSFSGDGSFLLTPIPFGSRCRFLAKSNDRYILSDELGFDEKTPIQNMKFEFGPGQTIHVRVVGPDGRPAANAKVSLSLTLERYGSGGATRKTDENGEIAFEHVNEVEDGQYSVHVQPGWNYSEQMAEVSPGDGEVTIKLVAGLTLSGQVVNQLTNQPIGGARVNANPPYHSGQPSNGPMSTIADPQGRFTFNNLASGEYRLFVENYTPPGATVTRSAAGTSYGFSTADGLPDNVATAGQAAPVTLRVQPETP